jgi:SAM-dependent methyltransferase
MSNPKDVVRDGYDALSARYLDWTLSVDPVHRLTYQQLALDQLGEDALIIELGCGPGTTAAVVADRHRYVGVDFSASQLALARAKLPSASFVRADMTEAAFRPGTIDCVLAFYSLIHVPRDEQPRVLRAIQEWLRPGGLAVFNMTAGQGDPGGVYGWIDDVPMYWSGFDAETNMGLVRDAGLVIDRDEVLENFEDDETVRFLWVLAHKEVQR